LRSKEHQNTVLKVVTSNNKLYYKIWQQQLSLSCTSTPRSKKSWNFVLSIRNNYEMEWIWTCRPILFHFPELVYGVKTCMHRCIYTGCGKKK